MKHTDKHIFCRERVTFFRGFAHACTVSFEQDSNKNLQALVYDWTFNNNNFLFKVKVFGLTFSCCCI